MLAVAIFENVAIVILEIAEKLILESKLLFIS